jgi:hypothetical protein
MSRQDVYVATIKLQLDELNAELKMLESRGRDATRDAQLQFDRELRTLRELSTQAGARLDEMQDAAQGTWHTLVADMEKLRDAFSHSFHGVKSQS